VSGLNVSDLLPADIFRLPRYKSQADDAEYCCCLIEGAGTFGLITYHNSIRLKKEVTID